MACVGAACLEDKGPDEINVPDAESNTPADHDGGTTASDAKIDDDASTTDGAETQNGSAADADSSDAFGAFDADDVDARPQDAGDSDDGDDGGDGGDGVDDGNGLDPGDAAIDDSDSGDAGTGDAGAGDGEPSEGGLDDAGMEDSGSPLCAAGPGIRCGFASACGATIPPPITCEACTPSNHSLCAHGQCESPEVLSFMDQYIVTFRVTSSIGRLRSFSAFAVADRPSGTVNLSCEDIYEGRVSIENPCLNILDSRGFALAQPGDVYSVALSNFASGQRTLFVIFGHQNANASGPPLGVSCTELDVPPPTQTGPHRVEGDEMRPL